MKSFKSLAVLFSLVTLFSSSSDVFAAGDPSACVVTIKSVQLQKESGEWITVIEPDRRVDLVNQEPTVSFFNNGRRVPPGNYNNFKIFLLRTIKAKDDKGIDVIYEAPHEEIVIDGNRNFLESAQVKRQSFVSVWFELNLSGLIDHSDSEVSFSPPHTVKQAVVTVDDKQIVIPGENIRITF